MKSGGFEVVQERCRQLVKWYGGQNKAAKAIGMSKSHFSRLLNGKRDGIGDEMLSRLDIHREEVFTARPFLFGIGGGPHLD